MELKIYEHKAQYYETDQMGIIHHANYLHWFEEARIDIMEQMGIPVQKIHAGKANMFLSPLFRETLAGVTGAVIELYDTDGSVGAAKGAGIGAGIYKDNNEAFATLEKLEIIEPGQADRQAYADAYARWKQYLMQSLRPA